MFYMALGGMILFLAVSACLLVRLCLLKNALGRTADELREIRNEIEENRILKMDTSDRELERLLKEMNDTLYEIRREKTDFDRREKEFQRQIEDISHDLRTPLTSILGYLKLMNQSDMTREERDDFQIIQRKAEVLQRLIGQFYDFSRAVSSDYTPQMETIDVARILREAVLDSYGELERRHIACTIEIPDSPMEVRGNSEAVERVISNLLQNVKRYGKEYLHIRAAREGDKTVLFFENDRGDLSEEEFTHLFDRFYVKDKARGSQGTGLGLTIAKSLMEKMEGSLEGKLTDPAGIVFQAVFRNA
ncbi:MAG TPA: HAMP domain-containing histidine kinase [Candidatus Choladousia intestinigallinarum]|nr:HAMP domain-containing histidine kinase [Candidatus Choladousia intestinigallinarum]